MTTRIYTTLALRRLEQNGCIERASTVRQDAEQEGTGGCRARARVAWRVLGGDAGDKWMVSCRTPLHLRGNLDPCDRIGDGRDEAMVAWLLGKAGG